LDTSASLVCVRGTTGFVGVSGTPGTGVLRLPGVAGGGDSGGGG